MTSSTPAARLAQSLLRAGLVRSIESREVPPPNSGYAPSQRVRFNSPYGDRGMFSGLVQTVWPNGRYLTIQGKQPCPWVVDVTRTRVQVEAGAR